MSHDPGVWLAALLTLAILSFLYKDNLFYRLAENIFVGVSSAWLFATYLHADIIEDMLLKAFPHTFHQPGPANLLPLGGGVIGLFILLRLVPRLTWLSRLGVAFVIGFQTALQIVNTIEANILRQVQTAMVPLFSREQWGALLRNWVATLGTLSSLSYFYFSKEQKGIFGLWTRLGIWFLMVAFGAAYGAAVMTRMSILIGRVYFLFSSWLGVVK